jgi:hypothetical protein
VRSILTWALDHVFFATSEPASVEAALAAFGLDFSVRRVHEGQGTANACAPFENAFFEIVRVHDLVELRSEAVRPLGLDERIRWRETGACPFGLAFRVDDPGGDRGAWPFETWVYEPADLPPGMSIPIATAPGRLAEPLVFVSHRPKIAGAWPYTPGQSPLQKGARRTLTGVAVQGPWSASPTSPAVRWFLDQGLFEIKHGPSYALELEWDGGREQRCETVQADVPIIARW